MVILGKNENHGFEKLAGLNPHKCLQSDVGDVWDQKEMILTWLVHSQVPSFWFFGLILWLGGDFGENENQGFGKLAGVNPHKCLQSDV